MYVYLTAHMREGISARPGVAGGVTGSGGILTHTLPIPSLRHHRHRQRYLTSKVVRKCPRLSHMDVTLPIHRVDFRRRRGWGQGCRISFGPGRVGLMMVV